MPILDGRTVTDRDYSAYVNEQNAGQRISEYPKMLYRPGPMTEHDLANVPLKMQGKHEVQTLTVNSTEEELIAMEDGWGTTPDHAPAKAKKEAA